MYEEGKARIKYEDKAFLNPLARASRDISVAFVRSMAGKDTRILDPTAATGIRGIRYYLETPSKDVTLLDINAKAALAAKRNAAFNKAKAKVLNESIQGFANAQNGRFDVIDLDPFGSAAPDIYDIMKLCKDGTQLFVTATDTAVLCGAHQKACIKIYDAMPLHNELCQEAGLRILIGFIARVAAQFNMGIRVLLSLSYAHYFRVMLQTEYGAEKALASVGEQGYAYFCSRCGSFAYEKAMFPNGMDCRACHALMTVHGKMWMGKMQDQDALKTISKELEGENYSGAAREYLRQLIDELDTPFFFSIPMVTKRMHKPSSSHYEVMDALKRMGFRATPTLFDRMGVKTDADLEHVRKAVNEVPGRKNAEGGKRRMSKKNA